MKYSHYEIVGYGDPAAGKVYVTLHPLGEDTGPYQFKTFNDAVEFVQSVFGTQAAPKPETLTSGDDSAKAGHLISLQEQVSELKKQVHRLAKLLYVLEDDEADEWLDKPEKSEAELHKPFVIVDEESQNLDEARWKQFVIFDADKKMDKRPPPSNPEGALTEAAP